KYKELKKLTFTDIMTQVYNRNYYEKICKKIVNEDNFPIGLIMADANGLKLVNDTLGHSEGDKLLINIAQILKEACNSEDYVFRIGGDEFIILTPNSDENKCEKLMKDILDKCKKYEDIFINPSISLGFSIIDDNNFDINKALKEAEDKVYLQKLLQKNSLSSSILNSLMISMEEKSYETEEHSNRVVKYSIEIGKRVSLSMSAMDELILVAKLHDIGKIGIDEAILLKSGNLTDEEYEIAKSHTEKGYRIVKASNQLDSVAKGVLTHHERWDGNGYPLKLKGESIPLVARIVAVADAYDIMTTDTVYKKARTRDEAIGELKINAGHQFDPKIVEVFTNYLEKSKDVLKI
ncbi:bifunctional diguanylate cyclase/phosphohydrolase, partial [Clostridium butyricum]